MIDQPEFSVAADSKYKSLKPDDMVALAEALRSVLNSKLAEDYFVVDEPGLHVTVDSHREVPLTAPRSGADRSSRRGPAPAFRPS